MANPKIKEIAKEWAIPPKGEFRFEVAFTRTVSVKLLQGCAEIFGTELSPNKEYELSGAKLSVFSYEGASIQVRGECEVEYVSEETPMSTYLNAFFALETLRQRAFESQDEPPRLLLVGESRHTLAKVFLNYSIRQGKQPTFVDLDCNKGSLLFPGVIASQTVDKVIDIEEGFPEGHICSYFYGNYSPSDNNKMYTKLMSRLAFAVNGRLAALEDPLKSGAIIVAPEDAESLLASIQELFKIDLIFVIGSERLHSTIAKSFQSNSRVSVLKLPLSGGVVKLDASFHRLFVQRQFQRYFYGARSEYTPFSTVLSFDEVNLRRLGEEALAPSSALPLGATRKISETRTIKVDPIQASLLYSILAVSWATSDNQLADTNSAGYVYVTAVDEAKKQLTILSPCPGKLPSSYLVIGNIKWIEK